MLKVSDNFTFHMQLVLLVKGKFLPVKQSYPYIFFLSFKFIFKKTRLSKLSLVLYQNI